MVHSDFRSSEKEKKLPWYKNSIEVGEREREREAASKRNPNSPVLPPFYFPGRPLFPRLIEPRLQRVKRPFFFFPLPPPLSYLLTQHVKGYTNVIMHLFSIITFPILFRALFALTLSLSLCCCCCVCDMS